VCLPTLLLLLQLLTTPANSQPWPDRGADAVDHFTPGTGQTTGQGSEYFPHNILGLPDTSARYETATTDPNQIVSLGLGGEIVLRFDRHVIVDGPGPDFTVFENAFHYKLGQRERIYAEPGQVAVSRDGITFTPFPFDSLTLEGCAGVTPTNGDKNPTDPTVSGGDSFDLATIGVDSIRYIRIRDVTSMVLNNPSHPFRDLTLSGFDLDAIVAVNAMTPAQLHVNDPKERGMQVMDLR
jgi:hypothetical protein